MSFTSTRRFDRGDTPTVSLEDREDFTPTSWAEGVQWACSTHRQSDEHRQSGTITRRRWSGYNKYEEYDEPNLMDIRGSLQPTARGFEVSEEVLKLWRSYHTTGRV